MPHGISSVKYIGKAYLSVIAAHMRVHHRDKSAGPGNDNASATAL